MPRVIAAVLVVTLSACGLTMTTGPDPRRPPDQRPVCTETMDAPKRDGVGAVIGFFAILAGVLIIKNNEDNEQLGAAVIVGGAAVTIASYVSGGIGYYRVKKCRGAVREFDQRPTAPAGPPGAVVGSVGAWDGATRW